MQHNSNRGRGDPMTTRTLIRTAIPHDTAKTIARDLGVTYRQGRRIAAGKVPGRFRPALIGLLERAIARNQVALERANAELREIEIAEMLGRAADRRAAAMGQGSPVLPGLVGRTKEP